jgi:hypothetical protein
MRPVSQADIETQTADIETQTADIETQTADSRDAWRRKR